MKLPARLLLSLILVTVSLSACHNNRDKIEIKNPNTPQALQGGDNASSLSIYRSRADDLIEEIYNELLEKRPDLKKLEADIAAYNTMEGDSLGKYDRYERQSAAYYNQANNKIKQITDSTLKKEMQQIIAKSSSRYNKKMAAINSQLNVLGKNDSTLNNYHIALKLLVTLPLMEQFQNDEFPGDKTLHTLATEKQKLIDRTQKTVPKAN